MDEKAYFSILDAIYNAAVTPTDWSAALEKLGAFFNCHVATLVDRNLKTLTGNILTSGADEADRREYLTWTTRNVFIDSPDRLSAGAIVTDQQILPKSRLLASDFYKGYLHPRDLHSLLRFSLRVEDNMHQSISILRSKSFGEFSSLEIERSRVFLPHLQRSASVSRNLNVSAGMMQTISGLLELQKDGVILLDSRGVIIFANRAARSMAASRDSFELVRDQIEALNGDNNRELQTLISCVIGKPQNVQDALGGVMKLDRRTPGRGYVAVVTSLSRNQSSRDVSIPTACIVITDPDKLPVNQRAMTRKLFGLTSAESQMAERLMLGDTPEQAAARMNTKIATARSHLAQVFRKTNTNRQSELIGLLMRLPRIEAD